MTVEQELTDALRAMGLLGGDEVARFTALAGGVSSDIWRVDRAAGPICVKRAAPKLRVERDWFVPVERWQYEYRWFEEAGRIVPDAVPRLLGADPARGLFAMDYLDPARFRLWKTELRDGRAAPDFAAAVGRALAAIHAATAGRDDVAARFRSGDIFNAIRLDPYLGEAARRHPDLASTLQALIARTRATERALVHGDVSPKNILVGPKGPVFLDAECAWYGDPAFDLAFCLNHLLLKCRWNEAASPAFLRCFDALAGAYRAGTTWEPPDELASRAASLLPGLLLARIDGKSPVEYITDPRDKERIRRLARLLILSPPPNLDTVRQAWAKEFGIEDSVP